MTVAINRAISIRNRVPVDIWACWDHPDRLFEVGYGEHIYPPLVIWLGPARFAEFYEAGMGKVEDPAWEEFLHPLIGLRSMPYGWRTTDAIDELGEPQRKAVSTLIYSIEKAVQLGAKHIRIFGADMVGSWSEGRTEEECEAKWGNRWEWERSQLAECVRMADEEMECFIECL